MSKFCVVVPVYNEENRIDHFLQSIPTNIDVIALDKSSTDDSKIRMARYPNVRIFDLPFGPPSSEFLHWDQIANRFEHRWCLLLVVSQTLDETLFEEMERVVKCTSSDVIELPFRNYTLKTHSTFNPWPSLTYKALLRKKSAVKFHPRVHQELAHSSTKVLRLNEKHGLVHHQSNLTIDQLVKKSVSYAKQEADQYRKNQEVHSIQKRPLLFVLRALFNGFIRRRMTIFRGPKGVLLGSCYVISQLLIVVYVLNGRDGNERN